MNTVRDTMAIFIMLASAGTSGDLLAQTGNDASAGAAGRGVRILPPESPAPTAVTNGQPVQPVEPGWVDVTLPPYEPSQPATQDATQELALALTDRLGQQAQARVTLSHRAASTAMAAGQPTASAAIVDEGTPWLPPGRRHALVVGNQRYQHWPTLETPRADAQAVAGGDVWLVHAWALADPPPDLPDGTGRCLVQRPGFFDRLTACQCVEQPPLCRGIDNAAHRNPVFNISYVYSEVAAPLNEFLGAVQWVDDQKAACHQRVAVRLLFGDQHNIRKRRPQTCRDQRIGGFIRHRDRTGVGFRFHFEIGAIVDLHDSIACFQRQSSDNGNKLVEIHGVSWPGSWILPALLIKWRFAIIVAWQGNIKIS